MSDTLSPADREIPHARDVPAWSDCGDVGSPDYGTIFADKPFMGTCSLWFHRTDRRDSYYAGGIREADLADTMVMHGRRFDVVRWDAETVERAEAALAAAELGVAA